MAKIKRSDFVASSLMAFVFFLGLSITCYFTGSSVFTTFLDGKALFGLDPEIEFYISEFVLVVATILSLRSYIKDRQLLKSSKDKYMNVKPEKKQIMDDDFHV